MTSRDLVDPELLPILDIFPDWDLSEEALPALRANAFAPPPASEDILSATTLEQIAIPGLSGAPDVPAWLHRPRGVTEPLGCLLHVHGGGYIMGSAREFEPLLRATALELGCVILSVDYRLAPETRFPGAVEDCYAALGWIWQQARAIGVDDRRIGVRGESAGGGLAAALSLLARDRGEYRLGFQQLIYPMLDDRTSFGADQNPYAGEFIWKRDHNAFGWRALIGETVGGDDVSPYAAAARAESLAGLPPTFISTGALDLFVDEDIAYGGRLLRAGVPTELHVYPGAFHGFDFFGDAAVSHRARADTIAALHRFLKVA